MLADRLVECNIVESISTEIAFSLPGCSWIPAFAGMTGASGVYDYEYERNGVSNLFMLFAPLEGGAG